MFTNGEFGRDYAVLGPILNILSAVILLGILWVIGRMGDNVNKIRKILEKEIDRRI